VGPGGPGVLRNALFQNYPNPFGTSTTVGYAVSREHPVRIEIFNVLGRKVRTLIDENTKPGRHSTRWDGTDEFGYRVSPGVYLCRIEIGSYRSTKKMLVVR
jgi:flagellar hook assembly protein FlgD